MRAPRQSDQSIRYPVARFEIGVIPESGMGVEMDPRQKIADRYQRLQQGQVLFVESYREIVLEPQSLGKPLEREIIVIRIDKSKLQLYATLLVFVVVLGVVTVLAA
jgi:hypothetical protein